MPQSRKGRSAPEGPARILIVDDHPMMRHGLRELIDNQPDLTVCGEAEAAPEALSLARAHSPDLVIVDLSLKEGSGLDLIKQIRAANPRVRSLVLSMHDENLYAERALRAGAMGFVHKQESPDTVLAAIRRVVAGKVHMSERIADRLLHRVVDRTQTLEALPVDTLSDRELDILRMIGEGLGTRQIAEILHLSPKTVETHRDNIKAKLQLKTSTELTRFAVQWVLEHE